MVRAPYPARIAAGLLVTCVEETRKLPTLVFTLPMTAVSNTLQFGMRLQQNIAELAIKGDAALEHVFDKPEEQPSWARFDDDEDPVAESSTPTEVPSAPKIATPPVKTVETPAPKPAKKAVKKAPKKAPATAAPTPETADQNGAEAATGRFALYSSAPEAVVTGSATPPVDTTPTFDGPVPEIVEYIEYDGLTLAQLRAKLRSVDLAELEELTAYEKATKSRAPFLTMLENRITAQSKKQSTT